MLVKRVGYIKDSIVATKKKAQGCIFIPMEMSILGHFRRAKNMGRADFIGLIYLPKTLKRMNMWNFTRENGGVDFPTGKECTKRSMEIFI